MACALSGNSCSISASTKLLFNRSQPRRRQNSHYAFRIRASSTDEGEDCNAEECAPDKEVIPLKKNVLYVAYIHFVAGDFAFEDRADAGLGELYWFSEH